MAKRLVIVALSVVAAAVVAIGAIVFLPGILPAQGDRPTAGDGITTEDDDDFGSVDIYRVVDGALEPAASGLTQDVWDTFVRVVTPDFAAEVMSQYRVGDAPDSDTLAYVYQDDDPDRWILATNLATSQDKPSLIATLVHEYAHILTLDGTQMDRAAGSCPTIELSEGCALDDSYLRSFEQQFWAGYDDSAPTPDNSDSDVAYDFYLAHEEDFVSDYAATNVVEDIAESFMTFVLEDRPADATASVSAAKIDFFWNYPELEAIRERIRTEFADDLGINP
ncbi:MAG: hypothetical protein BGO97_00785 [Micrococcales bacterium 70-64]|nr:NADH:ubiquinone oxidoreductase subunit 4 (chain M) [Leifsonia sp.]ODU65762.1 MAG: hypothetical protein ABT06_00785 [Leifsonia sp. SCN 70-46]OJX84389.1 MAG: hypothetical protein BGO97_00785 [Micrococcales bacterium 70-64]